MQQWQKEQAAKEAAEQHLAGAHQKLRATQLRLNNLEVISAITQSQLEALQAAQQAARSEGERALAQLQNRYDRLMHAYNVGKEMFEVGKAEMSRRDAAHTQLVEMHTSLAESEEKLEQQNRILTFRLHQLVLQRNALQARSPSSTLIRQLADITKEKDDLELQLRTMEEAIIAQYEQIAQADRTIDRLTELINKPSGK